MNNSPGEGLQEYISVNENPAIQDEEYYGEKIILKNRRSKGNDLTDQGILKGTREIAAKMATWYPD